MSADFKDTVKKIDQDNGQPDGIHISNSNENLTIHDFLVDAGNDDSNTSNESFKHDEG